MSRLSTHGARLWLAALAFALAFLYIDSSVRLAAIRAVTSVTVADVPVPPLDSASPSGYAAGQHNLILPLYAADSYHWILQTQAMLAGDDARVRTWSADNAPQGREVHWSAVPRAWLVAVGTLQRVTHSSLPLPLAVERAAASAGPLLLAIFLLLLTPLLARHAGALPAALFALGSVALPPLYLYSSAGFFDHHNFAALSALAAVLCLAVGVRHASSDTAASTRSAHRWFAASAIAAATGMWISAATLAPVMLGIGIGALLSLRICAARRDTAALWRLWGVTGGVASLFFYLLEYFPSHMGIRLEVNHPLYAVAWIAAGDLLYRIARARARDPLPPRTPDPAAPRASDPLPPHTPERHWVILDAALIALIPALVLFAPRAVFHIRDPFLWTLHRDYILEFQSLLSQPDWWNPWQVAQGGTGVLPLLLLAAVALAYRAARTVSADERALLTLTAAPAALMLTLSLLQVRWLGIGCALWLAFLVTAAAIATRNAARLALPRARRILAVALLAVVLVPFPLFTALFPWRDGYTAPVDLYQVVTRDVAHMLRARHGAADATVLSSPTSTTWLMYFGGFRGVGTLYWENLDGLKAAAAIYAARTDAEARALIAARNITHIVLFSWDTFAPEYIRLARGESATTARPAADAFAGRLLAGDVPSWLRRVDYTVPSVSVLGGTGVHIYEVAAVRPD